MEIVPERNSRFSLNEHQENKAIIAWSLQACQKKEFSLAIKYNILAQYGWGFFYFSLHLLLLWRNWGSNSAALLC